MPLLLAPPALQELDLTCVIDSVAGDAEHEVEDVRGPERAVEAANRPFAEDGNETSLLDLEGLQDPGPGEACFARERKPVVAFDHERLWRFPGQLSPNAAGQVQNRV
jgi:hypothetical protein